MPKVKNDKQKRLKIIHDIIPPHLMRDVIFVEKKVSKIVKASYFFLKTSKYGSIILVLGIALLGGTFIMGFSPKTEITEIYPTQYEGDWRNMEKALDRNILEKADILEFSSDNSTSVIKIEKEIDISEIEKEILPGQSSLEENKQDAFFPPETKENIDQTEDNSTTSNLPLPEDEQLEDLQKDIPAEQAESIQSVEPADEENIEPAEEISFLKKTRNLFSALEASAENIEEEILIENDEPIAEEETVQIEDAALTEKEIIEKQNLFHIPEEEEEDKFEEEQSIIDFQDNFAQSAEPIEDKEKFEDYGGTILPDVDGNLLFETQEKIEEETQTVFTKELNAVYYGFPVPQEKGELKKLKAGFSFANLEKKNEDDIVIVLWSLDNENWNTLLELELNKNYSNKDNGGYFYADIFDLSNLNENKILEWKDIENIKIKFSYLTNNNEDNYVPFFLDAMWLEAESEITEKNIREEEIEKIKVLSFKKDFKIDEKPEFKFKYKKEKDGFLTSIGEALGIIDYWKDINLTAEIIDPNKEIKEINFKDGENFLVLEQNGEVSLIIENRKKFKPGLYKLKLKIEKDGNIQTMEYDFTWGVLVINVNKSIYLSGEEAYLQMGVLKDDGHTICDARLELRITNQELGIEALLSTENGTILYSGQCSGNNVTDIPDYFAYYTTSEAGVYEMKLTNLDNGYKIMDTFEVRPSTSSGQDPSIPFDVERIGPSRIYPPADYNMVLKIKANQDFSGDIIETVPEGFKIVEADMMQIDTLNNSEKISAKQRLDQHKSASITTENGIKKITWNVEWQADENYELKYQFNAPNISPYIYLLGPLEIKERKIENEKQGIIEKIKDAVESFISGNKHDINDNLIFREIRQWQIASDALAVTFQTLTETKVLSDTSITMNAPANFDAGDLFIAY
ncbi:MAG: hypothetical protein KAS78_06130, partial [Candidatus Pacebacteria bacterium]|nr:hypothetical protein [Candidatus Paceibacterota bacterium]